MSFDAITTILFDLDGTLLPLDQEAFMHGYIDLFGRHCAQLGYDAKAATDGLLAGLQAMLQSDGSLTNKERFDQRFSTVSRIESEQFNSRFAPFYDEIFNQLRAHATPNPQSREVVEELSSKGYDLVLATSPLFPWQATHARVAWAGLEVGMFTVITTYEHCRYAKPHLEYYRSLLATIDRTVAECLMVGNDVDEDMVVSELGMEAYLVTDCLINRGDRTIDPLRRGSFEDFHLFCKEHL